MKMKMMTKAMVLFLISLSMWGCIDTLPANDWTIDVSKPKCPREFYPAPESKIPFVIPMTEAMDITDERLVQLEEGLQAWQHHTHVAIIITRPEMVGVFRPLKEVVPAMTIIPGFRTDGTLQDMNDVKGWERISKAICEASEITGSPLYVLAVHLTFLNANYLGLEQGLGELPEEFSYIWYGGSVNPQYEPRRAHAFDAAVRRATKVLGNRVHFVSYAHFWPDVLYFMFQDDCRIRYLMMREEIKNRPLYLMKSVAWQGQFHKGFEDVGVNNTVLLEIPLGNWEEEAENFLGWTTLDTATGDITEVP